jgi:hypothetical protein
MLVVLMDFGFLLINFAGELRMARLAVAIEFVQLISQLKGYLHGDLVQTTTFGGRFPSNLLAQARRQQYVPNPYLIYAKDYSVPGNTLIGRSYEGHKPQPSTDP